MPTFRYSAFRPTGAEVSGTIDAESTNDARLRLKHDGLYPKEIVPDDAGSSVAAFPWIRKRARQSDLALATRRLATLAGSAVPLHDALTALLEQEKPGELKNALGRVRERVREGSPFARALAAEPHLFGESFVAMISAGEAGGSLEIVLERLADFQEAQAEIRSRVTTALAYPTLMLLVGSGVMLFLLAFVFPKITVVFEQSRASLPFITRVVMAVSGFLKQWWWTLVVGACAALLAYDRLRFRPAFQEWRDAAILRVPVFGPLAEKLVLARFGRVMGLLVSSGVPLVKSLEIVMDLVGNRVYRAVLTKAKEEILQGGSLSSALSRSRLFPPLLVQMIGVGEKSGELEQMLNRAGTAFEKEFDSSVARSMALLEPVMVLAMGLAVGTVVVAVLLPIFELNQMIR
jgi:general secretion pathway protein F